MNLKFLYYSSSAQGAGWSVRNHAPQSYFMPLSLYYFQKNFYHFLWTHFKNFKVLAHLDYEKLISLEISPHHSSLPHTDCSIIFQFLLKCRVRVIVHFLNWQLNCWASLLCSHLISYFEDDQILGAKAHLWLIHFA